MIIKPKCIDCGKELVVKTAKRCRACNNRLVAKNRDFSGKNNPRYIDGRTNFNREHWTAKYSYYFGERSEAERFSIASDRGKL